MSCGVGLVICYQSMFRKNRKTKTERDVNSFQSSIVYGPARKYAALDVKIRELFPDVAAGESVITHFPCSFVHEDTAGTAGKMLITEEHLFFFANHTRTKLMVPVFDVENVEVVSSELRVKLKDGTIHCFTSFEAEREIHRCLWSIRDTRGQAQRFVETLGMRPMEVGPPQMSVLLLVVGTYGDVAPFTQFARHLQACGHRVRLATHKIFRKQIEDTGLEYYPLAGDPVELSAYMSRTGGRMIPSWKEYRANWDAKHQMMKEIMWTGFEAATMCDPDANGEGQPGPPFLADAVISNPVTYSHFHLAECLGAPLHLAFPQPWVETRNFPHPLACATIDRRVFLKECEESNLNQLSYNRCDQLQWVGLQDAMNIMRSRMNIPPLRLFEEYDQLQARTPFIKMWSPCLAKKPADWNYLVDVVGNFFDDTKKFEDARWDDAPPDFVRWLDAGDAPILITFGSMQFDNMRDPVELTECIYDVAKEANVRVLLQSGWTRFGSERVACPACCFIIGRAPHDWLMPRMRAVIHHGGAGTTAAGLRAALPTMICPFFGDQHIWGRIVEVAGVGPQAVSIRNVDKNVLLIGFKMLASEVLKCRAQDMAKKFSTENGVENGAMAFESHLPRYSMLCDVDAAVRRSPIRCARFITHSGVKLCAEVCAVLVGAGNLKRKEVFSYATCEHDRGRGEAYWAMPDAGKHPRDELDDAYLQSVIANRDDSSPENRREELKIIEGYEIVRVRGPLGTLGQRQYPEADSLVAEHYRNMSLLEHESVNDMFQCSILQDGRAIAGQLMVSLRYIRFLSKDRQVKLEVPIAQVQKVRIGAANSCNGKTSLCFQDGDAAEHHFSFFLPRRMLGYAGLVLKAAEALDAGKNEEMARPPSRGRSVAFIEEQYQNGPRDDDNPPDGPMSRWRGSRAEAVAPASPAPDPPEERHPSDLASQSPPPAISQSPKHEAIIHKEGLEMRSSEGDDFRPLDEAATKLFCNSGSSVDLQQSMEEARALAAAPTDPQDDGLRGPEIAEYTTAPLKMEQPNSFHGISPLNTEQLPSSTDFHAVSPMVRGLEA